MGIGQKLRSFDFFGTNVGLHFGRWIKREKGRTISYQTEIGGIITVICSLCFIVAFA